MNKALRKAVIAGNWKMNKTPAEAAELVSAIKPLVADADCEVVVCVPAIDIPAVAEAIKGSRIHLGAQNVHFEPSGAFTGEISASMLAEMGVEYVIVGHSERRQYFGETNETVNLRAKAAIAAGLTPIICGGLLLRAPICSIDGSSHFLPQNDSSSILPMDFGCYIGGGIETRIGKQRLSATAKYELPISNNYYAAKGIIATLGITL